MSAFCVSAFRWKASRKVQEKGRAAEPTLGLTLGLVVIPSGNRNGFPSAAEGGQGHVASGDMWPRHTGLLPVRGDVRGPSWRIEPRRAVVFSGDPASLPQGRPPRPARPNGTNEDTTFKLVDGTVRGYYAATPCFSLDRPSHRGSRQKKEVRDRSASENRKWGSVWLWEHGFS